MSSNLPVRHDHSISRAEMSDAIANGCLSFFYQPKVRVATGKSDCVEALVRWRHPRRGLMSAGDILPVVERYELGTDLAKWGFFEACRQIRHWADQDGVGLGVALNLSGSQLSDHSLLDTCAQHMALHRIEPGLMEIELTEDSLRCGKAVAVERLAQFRAAGLRVFLDDFGSGYCNFAYLAELPIDGLKIDRTLVAMCREAPVATVVMQTIIDLAKKLGLETVAEGVETHQDYVFLSASGCTFLQGYYLCEPVAADRAAECVRRFNRAP